jgi:UDP-N-acetylmuramoyl-L-alanyl-D-glutamate--2,6-diaminopimelate ligase
MNLGELAVGFPLEASAKSVEVTGIGLDSRAIKPGMLFAAMPGTQVDGLLFAGQAVERGAVAVLGGQDANGYPSEVPALRAQNPRKELAMLAARFYPRQPKSIAAITGTAGKTSVADFLRQIWIACGHPNAASVGTLGVVRPDGSTYGGLTTPDAITLHRTLDQLAGEDVDHLALEASSHGLDQYRLDGVEISAAGFTNLGRDHMDYHPTVNDYLRAKLRLFLELLPAGAPMVIEPTAPYAGEVIAAAEDQHVPILKVGEGGDFLQLKSIQSSLSHQRLTVEWNGHPYQINLPLLGRFQVSNAMIAVGLAAATGVEPPAALAALASLVGAPGRLQLIGQHHQAQVFVDDAHKPDALAEVLKTVRPVNGGNLIVVFGAGGDRDRGKRPLMGQIASELADVVYVTDDNPRSENPASIRAEILAECPGAIEIGERGTAIETAILSSNAGDVVVIAGKGHEVGQIVGDTTEDFSDIDFVGSILADSGK